MHRLCRAAVITIATIVALCPVAAFAAGYYPTGSWATVKTLAEPSDVAIAADGEVFVADATGRRIAVYSSSGSFLREFDGRTGPGTELVRPTSVAIGPDSLLYVADRAGDRVLVFQRTGQLVRWWGSRGSATGQFMSPVDLTVDASGLVYVADTFNNRVQVFSAAGVWQRTIGTGQISTPAGVAVKGNELFIAETNTFRVTVTSLTGTWLRDWGWSTSGSGPGSTTSSRYLRLSGIELDASGSILVVDAGRGLIESCNPANGVVSATYGSGFLGQPEGVHSGVGGVFTIADTLNNRLARLTTAAPASVSTLAPIPAEAPVVTAPKGLAVAPDGSVVVVESAVGRVKRLGADGGVLATFAASPSLSSPAGAVVSRYGAEVYVCDTGNSRIVVYSVEGAYLRTLGSAGSGPGQFSGPTAVAENIDGTLVVADTGNNRLQVIYPDGTFLYEVGVGRLRAPTGVATGPDGRIYVSDTGNHRILVFVGDGTYIRSLSGFGSGPGQVNTPTGLSMNPTGDRLLVADRGNHRYQLLSLAGTVDSVFGARGSGPGEFSNPYAGVFVSDGEIVVADGGNHRVGRALRDATPPVSIASGDTSGGWINRSASITLSASDGGAGLAATYYRAGDGPAMAYTGPVNVDTEGETTVTYWSVDQVGNVESPKSLIVRIDRIAPTGSTVFGTAATSMRTGTIPVESYVGGATEMRFGRTGSMGAWVPFAQSSSLAMNVEGPVTLVAEYRDDAGNLLTRTFATILDGTGPTTSIFRTPASGVSTGPVTIDISAADALSAVARIQYRVDGGPERLYTGPIAVSGDGPHNVVAYAVDAVGNSGATARIDFGISRLGLGGALSVAGGSEHIGYRTVEVSTTVEGAVRMRWNPGDGFSPWVPFLPSWYVSFPGDGRHELVVQFEDLVGQTLELRRSAHIDLTTPVTTATGVPPSGISAGPVMVALSTVDDSPVTITYRVDAGPERAYSAPFTVTGDGDRTVAFRATDAAGNVESEKTVTFTIAATPPAGSVRVAGGATRFATRVVDVEVEAPGAVKVRYDTGSGAGPWSATPMPPTARLTLPGEGLHWITATFANIAGVESQAAVQVMVDLTPPAVAMGGVPAEASSGPVSLWMVATDALSGVSTLNYRVDGGPAQAYRGVFTVSGDGMHTVERWATDAVGNTSARVTDTFTISSLLKGGTLSLAGGASRVGTLTVPVALQVAGAKEMRVDTGSGFSAWRPFASAFDIMFAREGTGRVRVQLRNDLGVETELSASIVVDLSPPTTTIGGLPPSGASAGPVIVVLTASDVSQVATVEYSVDGGTWRAYAGPFVVSGDGVHAVAYRSRDALGNQEPTRSASFIIAGDRPEGFLRPVSGRSLVNTSVVSLEASVAGATEMRFDVGSGYGPWVPYTRTATVPLPGPGLHWVVGAFRNVAGVDSTLGVPVLVDLAPPAVTRMGATLRSFTVGSDRVPRYNISLTGSAEDSGTPAAGVGSWLWRFGTRTSATGAFAGIRAGKHGAVVTVTDRAGNRGSRSGGVRLGAAAAPRVPATARVSRTFTVSGGVPWAGTGAVHRVYAYKRAANGSWVLAKSFSAVARVSRSTSTVTARVGLPRGQWRLVLASSRSGAFNAGSPSAVIAVR